MVISVVGHQGLNKGQISECDRLSWVFENASLKYKLLQKNIIMLPQFVAYMMYTSGYSDRL